MKKNLGPTCKACGQTEADCAWLGSCCSGCSHFQWLDANGNERKAGTEHCGSERGYQQHRWRREAACASCKAAHSWHNREERAS